MSKFYTVEDTRVQEFYQLPKDLILNPKYENLAANAKISYAILRDRHSVSLKNKWFDENGVYFLLSDNELASILNMTVRSASRYKNDLKKHELIHMVRQGHNKRNKIYLLKPEFADFQPKIENHVQVHESKKEPKTEIPHQVESEKNPNHDKTKLSNHDKTKMSNHDKTKLSNHDKTKLSTYSNNHLSNNHLSNKEEEEENLYNLISFFKKNISKAGIGIAESIFRNWLTLRNYDFILYEMTECAKLGAGSINYIQKAFNDSISRNLTTTEDLKEKYEEKPKVAKETPRKPFKRKTTRVEIVPENFNNQKSASEYDPYEDLTPQEIIDFEAKKEELLKIQEKYK